jgi:hypothetical protein
VVLAAATSDMARSQTRDRDECYPQTWRPQASVSMSGGMATELALPEQKRLCRRQCRTLPLWPSGMPSGFRTPADGRSRPVSVRRVSWLEEPVAGSAGAGGM